MDLGVLLMFLFSSAFTIWGPVRYSKFLVIPLMLSAHHHLKGILFRRPQVIWSIVLFSGLFITQLAYAWYLKILHTDNPPLSAGVLMLAINLLN